MNEENGLRGGKKYASISKIKGENHVFALESDAGGFTPRGFSFNSSKSKFESIKSWKKFFKPYLVTEFTLGGGGADIMPLKNSDIVLAGLKPDSQRYFDYHHSAKDTFESINKNGSWSDFTSDEIAISKKRRKKFLCALNIGLLYHLGLNKFSKLEWKNIIT